MRIQPILLISIERFNDTLQFHAIEEKGTNHRYTKQARLITNHDEVDSLLKHILANNFDSLVMYFQTKYGWYHQVINFSYGPMLRNFITEERLKNNNNKERRNSNDYNY